MLDIWSSFKGKCGWHVKVKVLIYKTQQPQPKAIHGSLGHPDPDLRIPRRFMRADGMEYRVLLRLCGHSERASPLSVSSGLVYKA